MSRKQFRADLKNLADGTNHLIKETGGVVGIYIITPEDGMDLLEASMLGDAQAARLLSVIARGLGWVISAPKNEPRICGCCPACVRTDDLLTFAIMGPADAEMTVKNVLITTLCEKCGARDGGLNGRVMDAFRTLLPDAREVVITNPEGGNA